MSELDHLSADEVIRKFNMVPLGGEGGMWAPISRNQFGNSICYLVATPDFSALHRLGEDELWVSVAGSPLLLVCIDDRYREIQLHRDHQPWHVVPAHTWMAAKPLGAWSLVVTSLAPAFSSMELTDKESLKLLLEQHPERANQIKEFVRD